MSAVASSAAERAARAGSGLSAASIHWGRRPVAPKPLAVTERNCRLLELLHDVNYPSSSQLALLGWGSDSTCTRRRLRLLHDRGLIDKFRPAAPAGSYEWDYRLTVDGWRMLSDRGMSADRKLYKSADIHSIAYVEHDLQVNALVLDLAHRARAGEGPTHTMRRTYVSLMLLATKFDVPFVQNQVGHTDSKLTMDVHAQLLDRSKRAHGAAFDALLADAQETLYGAQPGEFSPQFCPPSDFGPRADVSPTSEFGSDTGEMDNGRGGFRTCDLSRVKRALSH